MTQPILQLADPADLDRLLPMVASYHAFEGLETTHEHRARAVAQLLADAHLGRIYLIADVGQVKGYIALCFGYSIEFGGLDAFIDEFFLLPSVRGKGIGGQVLEAVKIEAREVGITALHLEVAHDNGPAKRLYARHGFEPRDKYCMISCEL